MPLEARCKKCRHNCAADNLQQFIEDYADAPCEKGGKHDFEPIKEALVDDQDWDNFPGGGML